MKITDLILQQYAPAARNIWLDTLTETEPVPEHTFSQEFEQVMSELVQEQKRQRLSGQPLQSGWNEEMARYKLDGTIQYQKLSPLSV